MATRYEHKLAAERADAARIEARADELLAGSPMKFDRSEMENGLKAFLLAKRQWHLYQGDARDYLSAVDIHTLYGTPYCQECKEYLASPRQYAMHMLGVDHATTSGKTSVAILNEVRAHILAFPVDRDDFWSFDAARVLRSYSFGSAPQRAIDSAPATSEG